jgi:nucleotide-binding universal stress UspA family protein
MYQRILVALDGSALAERILPYAEALGDKFGATLIVLRATTPPSEIVAAEAAAGAIPVSPAVADATEITEAEQRDAAGYLRGVAARLRARGLTVEVNEPEGRIAEAILARARDLRADLIAMTTHGRGGLGRALFGSIADEVLRHAPCPVLLVRVSEPDDRT